MTETLTGRRIFRFTPTFVSRTAGLSLDVVTGLESPQAAEWAAAMLADEARLRQIGDEIGRHLEGAIGDNDDQENRRHLLILRRDVHNLRLPQQPDAALSATQRHGEDLHHMVQAWLSACEAHHAAVADGERPLARDWVTSRTHLKELAAVPHFRRALTLAAPALEEQLDQYIARPLSGKLSKRARKQELSLLHYIYRTACKTSPFSMFTSVTAGRFVPAGDRLLSAQGTATEMVGHARLNVALIPRIVQALRTHPRYSLDLPLELVTGWEIHSERLRYLRRHRVSGTDAGAVTLDTMQENIFYLSAGQVLKQLIEILTQAPGTTLGALAQEMRQSLGLAATSEDVNRFLEAVVRLDLVTTPQLVVDIHADDPFVSFSEGVEEIGTPWALDLAERVREVSALASRIAAANADERRSVLDDLRSRLGDLMSAFGAAPGDLPKTLVYEDATTPGLDVTASAELWENGVARDLDRVSSILPVFDVLLPQRYLLEGFFAIRFGTEGVSQDLVRLVQDFHLDIFDEYMKTSAGPLQTEPDGTPAPPPNWLDLEDIDALHRARLQLVRGMREAYAAMRPGDTELVLTEEFFDKVAAEIPRAQSEMDSRSFFVQIADGDEPRIVLNQTYSGLTLLFSRFLHCLDTTDVADATLVERLREHLLELQPDGAVFAEITGGVDTTNLNVHPSVTPYEIVCPGDSCARPSRAQIHVADLEIHRDPGTGSLYLYSPVLNRRVIPVYLGFLLPFALSDVQRVLLLFSLTRMARLDLWTGTDAPLGDRVIASHPRVRFGSVILVRETWKTDPARLPKRQSYDSQAKWYLEWQRFRRDHHLPRFVFATLSVGSETGAVGSETGADDAEVDRAGERQPDTAGTMSRSSAKPQYIDFSSEPCLQLLDDMIRHGSPRLVFTEMLPESGQQWMRTDDGPVVTEQTIEMTLFPSEAS